MKNLMQYGSLRYKFGCYFKKLAQEVSPDKIKYTGAYNLNYLTLFKEINTTIGNYFPNDPQI